MAAPSVQEKLDSAVDKIRRQFARFMYVDLVVGALLAVLVSFRLELFNKLQLLGIMNGVSAALFFLDFIMMGWLFCASKDCAKVTDGTSNASTMITLKAKTWANFVVVLLSLGAFAAFVALQYMSTTFEWHHIGFIVVAAYMVLQLVELWSFTRVLGHLAQRGSGAAREPFANEAGVQELPDVLVDCSVSVDGRIGVVTWDGRPMNGYVKVKWSDNGEQSKVIKLSKVTMAV